jgi:hypothetical protein
MEHWTEAKSVLHGHLPDGGSCAGSPTVHDLPHHLLGVVDIDLEKVEQSPQKSQHKNMGHKLSTPPLGSARNWPPRSRSISEHRLALRLSQPCTALHSLVQPCCMLLTQGSSVHGISMNIACGACQRTPAHAFESCRTQLHVVTSHADPTCRGRGQK